MLSTALGRICIRLRHKRIPRCTCGLQPPKAVMPTPVSQIAELLNAHLWDSFRSSFVSSTKSSS